MILENPDGEKETYHHDLGKRLTCNQPEYADLVTSLEIAKEKNVHHIQIKGDSKLICIQISGNWEVKFEKPLPFYQDVKVLTREFKIVEIIHIPREQNYEANVAAKNLSKPESQPT